MQNKIIINSIKSMCHPSKNIILYNFVIGSSSNSTKYMILLLRLIKKW